MLNKLLTGVKDRIFPGDTVICAVSGGADSMALLWGMYLLREQLGIHLEAAHFNHGLRGKESDRDEAFVRDFCASYNIGFHSKKQKVETGKKGLEAAAREARYSFLESLPGKLLTAHTADDNVETILMHLIRGTGLNGLGGISPIRGNVIRPMLQITRQELLAFLGEYSISYVEDSSNAEDDFLRNRVRHHIVPLMLQENPSLKQDLSAMIQGLRQDEAFIQACTPDTCDVAELRGFAPAQQSRAIVNFLQSNGVFEPSRAHIELVRRIILSDNPSARVNMPNGVVVERNYNRLCIASPEELPTEVVLNCPGVTRFGAYKISCIAGCMDKPRYDCFVVSPKGKMIVRSRKSGDCMRLQGGTKTLKKIYVDKKIPVSQRPFLPVIEDERGILGVGAIGANLDRLSSEGVQICIELV